MPPAAFAPATHGSGRGTASSSASVRSFSSTRQQARGGFGHGSSNGGGTGSAPGATSTSAVVVIAPRVHRPRVLAPSHHSQEKPYFSDTTGPLHHSLRGSRLVLFPKATSDATGGTAAAAAGDGAAAPALAHLSNPNERLTRPHQFQHAPIRAPPEWAGDRSSVMRSSTQADYPGRDPAQAQAIAVAGCGGRVATARSHSGEWVARPSDLSTAPTPLQSLAASRHTDLLHAARLLQAKAAAAQQAADRLFETSARERYEVVREKNAVAAVNLTSPFFLGKPGASAMIGAPQTARERRMAPTAKIGAPARPASASSAAAGSKQRQQQQQQQQQEQQQHPEAAGLGRHRIRDWASDPSLRLVARADAVRSRDDYGHTFSRIVSDDPCRGGPARDALSTTAESLRAGRAQPSPSEQAFVPHFLRKIHPSLHGNLRRNVFANGNDYIDPLGSSSKFQTARFVPRAYNSEAGWAGQTITMTTMTTVAETAAPATTQQPAQVAQPAAVSQSSGGS